MEWLQVLTIVGSAIGCCAYFSKQTKAQMDKLEQHGRERDLESKDFHGRLCSLEERYIQMMERFLESRR